MITDTFDLVLLTSELTTDEGRMNKVYYDSRGIPSIGIGRNLVGVGLRDNEIDYLFQNDVVYVCGILDRAYPWWRSLPPSQQRVMVNLAFNLGEYTLAQFVRFLAAMKVHDFITAASELRNSAWFKEVGLRGPRMIARLLGSDAVA